MSALTLFVLPWIALAAPTKAPACDQAAHLTVQVPGGYDAVRVVTAPGGRGAAVVVSVAGGGRWTSLAAPAGGPTTLQTVPAPGGALVVAIEPSLDAPRAACVERIELILGGEVVARVAP